MRHNAHTHTHTHNEKVTSLLVNLTLFALAIFMQNILQRDWQWTLATEHSKEKIKIADVKMHGETDADAEQIEMRARNGTVVVDVYEAIGSKYQ